jgi:hypothetical protein
MRALAKFSDSIEKSADIWMLSQIEWWSLFRSQFKSNNAKETSIMVASNQNLSLTQV